MRYQLRYLQTLNSISAENNSTIVFPVPIDIMSQLMNTSKEPTMSKDSTSINMNMMKTSSGNFREKTTINMMEQMTKTDARVNSSMQNTLSNYVGHTKVRKTIPQSISNI